MEVTSLQRAFDTTVPLLKARIRLFLLFLFLACSFQTRGQVTESRHQPDEPPKLTSYGFVSSNTEKNPTLQQALRKLKAPQQIRLIREARAIGCRVGLEPRLTIGLGSWSDSAEQSTILRATTDESTLRYVMSRLGQYAQQKGVLYFRKHPQGKARMYVLSLPTRQPEAVIARQLDAAGISDRTLVPLKRRILVYVVDLKDEIRTRLKQAARRLRAKLFSLRGTGEFIGDANSRETAHNIFALEIQRYEASHSGLHDNCVGGNRIAPQ